MPNNAKAQNSNDQNVRVLNLEHWKFEFVWSLELGI
jgi:hypothetical protein